MPAQNEKNDHLPVLGVGPAYVIVITVLTVACITLSKLGILSSYPSDSRRDAHRGHGFSDCGHLAVGFRRYQRKTSRENHRKSAGYYWCLCAGQKPNLLRICVCYVGRRFAFKQPLSTAAAACVLGAFNCDDASHGGEVASRAIWR